MELKFRVIVRYCCFIPKWNKSCLFKEELTKTGASSRELSPLKKNTIRSLIRLIITGLVSPLHLILPNMGGDVSCTEDNH